MRRYPSWMTRAFSPDGVARQVRTLISDLRLATVCESALCPNVRECYSQRQLTFMILGDRCTRRCGFCAVDHGRPEPVAADEPWRVTQAVKRLGLRHVVITSVARDDLQDEGAGHFVEVIRAVRRQNPGVTVETLIPDFHGREELLQRLMQEGRPDVLAHNVETVERLSDLVRSQANYHRSLRVLGVAASLAMTSLIKSSVMVGLGETPEEVMRTFQDLRRVGVTHLTIGQYLRPDPDHLPVMEYVSPERFQSYERAALACGFRWVKAGPFVRSSYHAIDAVAPLGSWPDQEALTSELNAVPV
ncbi:MAG: lipoyl synthase [Candidatus Omnitrophica bacterium]|nr:lipoyl synthase [Candidatus Omnitrophota bacterium]